MKLKKNGDTLVNRRTVLLGLAGTVALERALAAQTSTQPQSAPCTPQTAHDKQLLTDFGWLARYKDANTKLGPPAPGENRVVFMGDSITEIWHLDQSFPGKPYINRGISGQTTPQMLVRFRQDVIDLQPKVAVLLGGTNDLAGNTGPMTPEQTQGNIESMAELATASGIHIVLCSIPPAAKFPWRPAVQPAQTILDINAWIRAYAARKDHPYVDYHSALKDSENGFPLTISLDGVHPKPSGFAIMAPLAEKAIEQALAQ
jgi:acyl-CoA thioesterase I